MDLPHWKRGIAMTDGTQFRHTTDKAGEVYGWLEKDCDIVKGTGGWWRTKDPMEAARLAADRFGYTVAAEQVA